MNPDLIYRQHRDDALADQIEAVEYSSFVAMPFGEQFSYRARDILTNVIQAAAIRANTKQKGAGKQCFSIPERVDAHSGTARVITEEIVRDILARHIFIADLTFQNPGVLLETGVALGLKPNDQIVLITQGKLSELHFNIRNLNVVSYNKNGSVEEIANALVGAADSFESDRKRYVSSITRTLAPDAILCLRRYGEEQQKDPSRSLWAGNAERIFGSERAHARFDRAMIQLLDRRLIETEWKVKALEGKDAFGMHATLLGWAVISTMWEDLKRPASPENRQ